MIAGNAGLDAEVFTEVAAHAFAKELLPSIAVLGHRGIGVVFLEGGDVGIPLFVGVIDARAGGEKETLDAELAGGDEQMRIDEHAEHAKRLVQFDEAHAAHVGGQVIDNASVFDGLFAGFAPLQIQDEVFDVWEDLVPLGDGFDIDGAQIGVALALKICYQMTADKAATTANNDFFAFHDRRGV